MLPAGYPPQLLFSSRPDAVVHSPRPFVALLPFCLSAVSRPRAAQPSSGFSAFPVRTPHSLPPVSQLFPSARRTAFLRFLHFPHPRAHSLSPVSPLSPSVRRPASFLFICCFPSARRTAFLRFLSFSRPVVPPPFPVFRSASFTSIKKAPRREPKIKTLLKIARIRRILQKVSEFSV